MTNIMKLSLFEMLRELRNSKKENYSNQEELDSDYKKVKKIAGIKFSLFILLLIMNLFFFFLTIVWIVKCSPIMSNFTRVGLWTLVILGLFVPGFSFLAFIITINYRYNTDCKNLKSCLKKDGSMKCKGKKGKWE